MFFASPAFADLHAQATILDLHADTPCQLVKRGGYSLRQRLSFNEIDVPRMRAGNLGGQFFSLWPTPESVAAGRADEFCRKALTAIRKAAAESGAIEMVDSVASFREVRARGGIGGFLGMEGAECLSGRVENLAAWRKEGVRYLGLTWNGLNAFATPAADRKHKGRGLTDLGRALVGEANRLGVLVDVSHASARTFWDTVRVARAPIIASHSSAAALRRHPRNLDDEQARAIARSGGVIGVNFFSLFLRRGRPATVDDVARHVSHFVRVAGAEHVALGSDFDGYIRVPRGLEDVSRLPNLTAALLAHGLTPAEVRLVLGKNVLRVLGQASTDVHRGPRLVPLEVQSVRPRAALRLFDGSDRTTFRPAREVRFAVSGQPTHIALVPCSPGAVEVRLRRGREVVFEESLSVGEARLEKVLPALPPGRYRGSVRGTACLREVTLYGP
jgi:membrane dipeptidase